jgi:Icc-related predicted phosphoesterase
VSPTRREPLTILHSSDLHGEVETLLTVREPFDVWVDTGDFFPNHGPVPEVGGRYVDALEQSFQQDWLTAHDLPARLTEWLGGRPLLTVPGNHDHVDLVSLTRESGLTAHAITPQGVDLLGFRWAGFREVPWMFGDSVGEVSCFEELLHDILTTRPHILTTHAPALGVLDPGRGLTIPGLAEILTQLPDLRLHLFGHEHRTGGLYERVGHYNAVNGARRVSLLTVDPHGRLLDHRLLD